jgi:hypothetical protein
LNKKQSFQILIIKHWPLASHMSHAAFYSVQGADTSKTAGVLSSLHE